MRILNSSLLFSHVVHRFTYPFQRPSPMPSPFHAVAMGHASAREVGMCKALISHSELASSLAPDELGELHLSSSHTPLKLVMW